MEAVSEEVESLEHHDVCRVVASDLLGLAAEKAVVQAGFVAVPGALLQAGGVEKVG